jgi:hypothetical protein
VLIQEIRVVILLFLYTLSKFQANDHGGNITVPSSRVKLFRPLDPWRWDWYVCPETSVNYLPISAAQHVRRAETSTTLLWKPKILHS